MATSVPPPPADVGAETVGSTRRLRITDRHRMWVRVALAVAWIGTALVAVLVGHREGTLAELRAAVASGDVEVVEASGVLPTGETGYTLVELRWKDGWTDRVAEVAQVVGGREARGSTARRDPVEQLRQLGAEVEVETGQREDSRWATTIWGFNTSPWIGVAALIIMLATLVAVPARPWRATGWAWFWLVMLLAPVGVPACLLLSGPPSPAPPPDARRLTGGWALVLSIVVLSAFGSTT